MTGITKAQIAGFEKLLASVDTDRLSMSDYAKRYLLHILAHRRYYCHIYARVLELALVHCSKPIQQICLVDYGAGNGLLGLFAKYCGFQKVYINEMSTDFLTAARLLADEINIAIDDFVVGEVDSLHAIQGIPDVLVATDVIEHIYNLEHFFATLHQINPAIVTVMTTASNPCNPFKVAALKKLQVKDELYGGTPADNCLFGEATLPPFVLIRERMIEAYSNKKISAEEISQLAKLTRGLNKVDIEKSVDLYLSQKIWPVPILHPTNTCDPVSGSWSERLLSLQEYKAIYSGAGFGLQVYDGFYNACDGGFKSSLLRWLNTLIPVFLHRISPFIILVGKEGMKELRN